MLRKVQLSKSEPEKHENMNRPITSTEIKTVTKNWPQPENRELFYLVGMLRTLIQGGSILVALRKLLQGVRRGIQAIYKFATKGEGSMSIKDYC